MLPLGATSVKIDSTLCDRAWSATSLAVSATLRAAAAAAATLLQIFWV